MKVIWNPFAVPFFFVSLDMKNEEDDDEEMEKEEHMDDKSFQRN